MTTPHAGVGWHGAILASLDEGFSRFPGLSWINPALDPTSNGET
jgi:hypothetical protein